MVAPKKSASNSHSSSDSDIATAAVLQNITREHSGSSFFSLEARLAALLQASKPFFRLNSCRGRVLLHASSFDAGAPILDGTVQFVLTDPPYNVWRLRKVENSAHDSLFFREMRNTVELMTSLLRPGGHAIFFCTDQQFAAWHTLFCKHRSRPNDGSSSSSAAT